MGTDRIRIPLRRIDSEGEAISEGQWEDIQKLLGDIALDEKTRNSIEAATLGFAMFGVVHTDENTVLLSELSEALEAWKRATDGLRRALDLMVDPVEETFGRIDVIRPFIEDDSKTFGRILPLELLARSVASATAAERVVSEELKLASGRMGNDLWSVWVCLVAIYLDRIGVKITANEAPKTESPFVKVIQALQSHLPTGCQRRTRSDDQYGAVATGIKRSRAALKNLSEKELLLILGGWGSGILSGYKGPLATSTQAEIAEFKTQAERVFADIKRQVAAADPDHLEEAAMDGET